MIHLINGFMDNIYLVARISEFEVGQKKCVIAGTKKLLLARLEDGFYAVDNICPHKQGQLCDGFLDIKNGEVICGLHDWNFDLKTGISPYNQKDKIDTFEVKIKGKKIFVIVPDEKQAVLDTEYLGKWKRPHDEIEDHMETIHKMAKGWIDKYGQIEPMRTTRQRPLWDDLVFLPRQLAKFPLFDDSEVSLKTVIGKTAKHPIHIDFPVYVSHMSFGALSAEAKEALARGAKQSGTLICSGEGGMLAVEQENAGVYIFEMASGYFGWNEKNIKKADAIEIKIGQAAKAGMGGVLPAEKITPEIAKIRSVKKGEDAVSPSRFPDIHSKEDLKTRVEEIRKINKGKAIGIKFAASRIEEDLEVALFCNPDFITIDGRGGATGAAPLHVKDNICIPTLYALDRVMRYLEKKNIKIDVLITGGLRTPDDFSKAIAMGATAIASASAVMMAIGCQQYRACHTNRCPVGIATQDIYYRKRFDIEESSKMLSNFFEATKNQLRDFARICGHSDIHDLSLADIATVNEEIAKYTRIKHVAESF